MIIFTSNLSLLPYINNCTVLNLSSYKSGYESITPLITNMSAVNTSGIPNNEFIYMPEFDITYMQKIINDPNLFSCFMKIMINTLNGTNVVILIAHDPYRDAITESLIKLIQVRYGYKSWEVETLDDLSVVKESYFTPYGILALDADSRQYDSMYVNGYIQQVANIPNKE